MAYASQGDYQRAIPDFSQAIALDPAFPGAYFMRGHAYIEIEEFSRAVVDYDWVIEHGPYDPAAYNNRCWSYFKAGEYKQALPDCEKALALAPDYVNALDSRARVYMALGRTEDAIFDFERIIELGLDQELSRQAAAELSELTSSEGVSAEISVAEPGTNLARGKTVRVSRALSDFPAAMAVDGKSSNWWGSGGFAPQWIVVDLGANYVIAEVRLLPSRGPTGETIHRLLVKGPATNNEDETLYTFQGATADARWVALKFPQPLEGIRYIRIETTSSPSWVSWREIEVNAGE